MLSFRPKLFLFLVTGVFFCGNTAKAQHEHEHEEDAHHGYLHFSHPLIAESPSPDTKVRFDYFFQDVDGDEAANTSHAFRLEAEYAFHPSFSIEVNLPYVFLNPDEGASASRLGNVEVGLKFANFAFAEKGVLLGYGLELGLPTGDDRVGIGSDHLVEVEPFFNLGYKRDRLEVVAFTAFGIPTNQEDGEEIETELGFNLSMLYHVSQRVEALAELDGETVLSGEESEAVTNLTAGIKLRPLRSSPLLVGLGFNLPVTAARAFDVRAVFSLFYHF